MHISLDVDDVL